MGPIRCGGFAAGKSLFVCVTQPQLQCSAQLPARAAWLPAGDDNPNACTCAVQTCVCRDFAVKIQPLTHGFNENRMGKALPPQACGAQWNEMSSKDVTHRFLVAAPNMG